MFILTNPLKKCPFCGSLKVGLIEAKMEDDEETHTFSVCCMDCMVGIFRPDFGANEIVAFTNTTDALNAWNRRPE